MKKRLLKALALIIVSVMAYGLTACAGGCSSASSAPPSSAAPGSAAPGSTAPGSTAPGSSSPGSAAPGSSSHAAPPSSAPPPAQATEDIRGDPVYLTWAHPFPATHHHNIQIVEPLIAELYEKSNGLINITLEPGGTITTGVTAISDVACGAVDIIWTLPGYTPGRFPLLDCIEFPNYFDSAVEATKVLWELFRQSREFADQFKEYKVFLIFSADMGEIWNSTRPIRTPADCIGLNLRSSGAMTERTMRALGLGAAAIPMPDVYDNVERGVIDGLCAGASAIPAYNLQEVVNYGTRGLNLFASPQMMAISWDAWNKLSPDLQALWESVTGEDLWIKAAAIYDEMGKTARQGITGVEYSVLTADEAALFREATANVAAEYIAELNGRGYNADAFHDLMVSIRDNSRK